MKRCSTPGTLSNHFISMSETHKADTLHTSLLSCKTDAQHSQFTEPYRMLYRTVTKAWVASSSSRPLNTWRSIPALCRQRRHPCFWSCILLAPSICHMLSSHRLQSSRTCLASRHSTKISSSLARSTLINFSAVVLASAHVVSSAAKSDVAEYNKPRKLTLRPSLALPRALHPRLC